MSIFGSMKTAVSGMNAQSNRLSAVADNIANVNTTGYKSASVAFSSLVLPSSSGNYNSGGVDSTTRYSISQEGSYSATTSTTDLSIKGDGFFIVQAADGSTVLTRAGDFLPDANGNLVNSAGFQLMGYSYDTGAPAVVVNGFDGLVPINIKQSGLTAIPSTQASFSGNLNSNQAVADAAKLPKDNKDPGADGVFKTSMVAYDQLGNTVQYDYYFTKNTEALTGNTWEVAVFRHDDAAVGGTSAFPYNPATPLASGTMVFDAQGNLTDTGTIKTTNTLQIDDSANAGPKIDMDLSKFTQKASANSGTGTPNGQPASDVDHVTIDKDGTVYANYKKGNPKAIYRIPLATVASPDLLTVQSGNVYSANSQSGVTVTGFASTNNMGFIQSGSLEESNVDLAGQLTEMIESQRSYTANSKVFQTGADILDVLVNLKR